MTHPCKNCGHLIGLHNSGKECLGARVSGETWTYCRCKRFEPVSNSLDLQAEKDVI